MSSVLTKGNMENWTAQVKSDYVNYVKWYTQSDIYNKIIQNMKNLEQNADMRMDEEKWKQSMILACIVQAMVYDLDWFVTITYKNKITQRDVLSYLNLVVLPEQFEYAGGGREDEIEIEKENGGYRKIARLVTTLSLVVVASSTVYGAAFTGANVLAPVAVGVPMAGNRLIGDVQALSDAFGLNITIPTIPTSMEETKELLSSVSNQLENIGNITSAGIFEMCQGEDGTCVIEKLGSAWSESLVGIADTAFTYVNSYDIVVPPGGKNLFAVSPDNRFQFPLNGVTTESTYGAYLQGQPILDRGFQNATLVLQRAFETHGVPGLNELIVKLEGIGSTTVGGLFNGLKAIAGMVTPTEDVQKLKDIRDALIKFNEFSKYLQERNPRLHMLMKTAIMGKVLGFSNDVTYDLIKSEFNVRRQIGQNVAGMVQDIPGRAGELAYTGVKVARNTAQIASTTFERVKALFVPDGTILIAAASADVGVDLIGIPRGGRKNRKSKKNKKTKTNKNKKNRKTNKRRRKRRAY